jgi:hypothetical protein
MKHTQCARRNLTIFLVAILMALAIAAPLSWTSAPGSAHFLGHSAARYHSTRGWEIRWKEYTQYDGPRQHGRDSWEQYGYVNWAPDNDQVPHDLSYYDYTDCSSTTSGFYAYYVSSRDTINFNTCWLDSFTTFRRNRTAAHESGHALGMAHNSLGEANSIMHDPRPSNPTINTPQQHDINDYYALYP